MAKTPAAPRAARSPQARRAEAAETITHLVGDCPIDHDGEHYASGDEIELTEYQAQRLGGLVTKAPALVDASN